MAASNSVAPMPFRFRADEDTAACEKLSCKKRDNNTLACPQQEKIRAGTNRGSTVPNSRIVFLILIHLDEDELIFLLHSIRGRKIMRASPTGS